MVQTVQLIFHNKVSHSSLSTQQDDDVTTSDFHNKTSINSVIKLKSDRDEGKQVIIFNSIS